MENRPRRPSRRRFIATAAALTGGAAALSLGMSRTVRGALSRLTRLPSFAATPPLVPHDPARDRRSVYISRGAAPADNVDEVLGKLGGLSRFVGGTDVVLLKVSAQWWNQGMTNVAVVRRVIEQVLALPGFAGEVILVENTHFRLKDGSGLSRAFTLPSERNVDVPGWTRMGDLLPHFAALSAPVSAVGLVDAGPSALADDPWHDPEQQHGRYGGDGRGPIPPSDLRDGYFWDFDQAFRLRRSLVDHAQTPLTWPRFTSPKSGLVIDLRDGVFRREGGRLHKDDRRLRLLSLVTANEHLATGMTGCCKSAMGLVDMSAGRLGTHAAIRDYQSVHYFGFPEATWRMAGPLAHFARKVRAPDLYIVAAEWVAAAPPPGVSFPPSGDLRLEAASAHQARAVVAGTDPVAVDAYCARHILTPLGGRNRALYNLDDPDSLLSRFLRYYRQVYEGGTLDPGLIDVA